MKKCSFKKKLRWKIKLPKTAKPLLIDKSV